MKVNGLYGRFTPRPAQVAAYRRRAAAQVTANMQRSEALIAWLEKHKSCSNGCGNDVAFYDTVHYALMHSGCCSAECESDLRSREG